MIPGDQRRQGVSTQEPDRIPEVITEEERIQNRHAEQRNQKKTRRAMQIENTSNAKCKIDQG